MKAVVIERYGGPEVLRIKEVERPKPAEGELEIRALYAGVNPVDWKIREGSLSSLFECDFPAILGWDVSGRVSKAAGEFKEGDEVYSYCRKPLVKWGAYAEYVVVQAEHVAKKPQKLSFAEAAGVPLAALTAWQTLREKIGIGKGQKLLVHAGAGGVGSYAIQFAKLFGAYVYTTASSGHHSYVEKLGADEAIDYREKDFAAYLLERNPSGIDAVFDCVGGDALQRSFQVVKRGGKLFSIVEKVSESELNKQGLSGGFHLVRPDGAQLRRLADLFDRKEIEAAAVEEVPVKQVAKAQEKSKEGHTKGKLVLKLDFS